MPILPDVDDRPETIEESIALAKIFGTGGCIHTAIATPHYDDLFPHRSAAEITERVSIILDNKAWRSALLRKRKLFEGVQE